MINDYSIQTQRKNRGSWYADTIDFTKKSNKSHISLRNAE